MKYVLLPAVMQLLVAVGCIKETDLYKSVSLNEFCSGTDSARGVLQNTSSFPSSAIVWATQQRMRSLHKGVCGYEISSAGNTGFIVTAEQMNLRKGLFNETCIDYVRAGNDYPSVGKNGIRCGKVTEEDNVHWTAGRLVRISLVTGTPVSVFIEENILRLVVTSYTDAIDGKCPDRGFRCDNNRCIFFRYTCDGVNNCGDNSDESHFGSSACLMPRSALLFMVIGTMNFVATWSSVIYWCLHKKHLRKKIGTEAQWGSISTAVTSPSGLLSAEGNAVSSPEREVFSTDAFRSDMGYESPSEHAAIFKSPLITRRPSANEADTRDEDKTKPNE
ncbi:uncharacterized protein LOC135366787 [Ornithodoros turicata]|uniref:uncharacterized protein LOC135366787 n=1 Tax=Ornithodoros turicata TaxID=34597 RepID=UPI00313A43E0